MLPVSYEYIDAIRAQSRDLRARVEITWTDPYIDQTIQVTTNDSANVSWPKQTADSKEEPAFKYAALDGTWTLGDYHLAPGTEEEARSYQMGHWSGKMAGPDGIFSEPYPRLTVRHRPRPVFELKVVGDSKRGEWPVDFEIRLYDDTNALVHTEIVTDNPDIYWQKSIEGANL